MEIRDKTGLFFQIDENRQAYREAKTASAQPGGRAPCERLRVHCPAERERRAHRAMLAWIDQTLMQEHPQLFPRLPLRPDGIRERWRSLGLDIQEDLVAVQRDNPRRRRRHRRRRLFPQWLAPGTHTRVGLPANPSPGSQLCQTSGYRAKLARAMTERGPYVRFVWTLCADDYLDHHPEEGNRLPWNSHKGRGWLRVERQVTVPFPGVEAALFLIRTYLTPFEALRPSQRTTLAVAIDGMPPEVLRYKDLNRTAVLQALHDSSHEAP